MVTKAIRGTTTLHTPGGSGSLSVSDGSTTVVPTTSIVFSGAVVTDGGSGEADVAISGSSSAFSGARLKQAADYTTSTGSFIQLPWDTTVFDVGGYVGSNAGNVCFIAPATGYYVIQAVEDWVITSRTSGIKIVQTWLQTTTLGILAKDIVNLPASSPATDFHVLFNLNTGPVHIASGDIIQAAAQDTHLAETVNGTTFGGVTYWTIMRVG